MREGAVLNDRYELRDVVGRGGMADVYRATDRVLHREVAVKVLRAATPEPTEKDRFVREARILARLDHPGLTTVLDAGVSDERPFLVMHLVDGKTLADEIGSTGLAGGQVARIGADVADALAFAHQSGVVHRDVKPTNVLLRSDGHAVLTDFGIARLLDDSARHTVTGVTMGTAAYVSPEQLGGKEVASATDVYSLGLVLLEALSGRAAYAGGVTETGPARLTASPTIPADLADPWRRLLGAMTAVDAAERPSAEQVQARLEALVGEPEPTSYRSTADSDDATKALAQTSAATTGAASTMTMAMTRTRQRLVDLPAAYVAATLGVVLVLALGVLVASIRGTDAPDETAVPDSVPADLRSPLQDLHDAIHEGGD